MDITNIIALQETISNISNTATWLGYEVAQIGAQIGLEMPNKTAAILVLKAPCEAVTRPVDHVVSFKQFKSLFRLVTVGRTSVQSNFLIL